MDRFEDFSSMSTEERQEWTAQAAGLSPEQLERYARRFQYPEYFPAVRHD